MKTDFGGLKDTQENGFTILQDKQNHLLEKLESEFSVVKDGQDQAEAKEKEEMYYVREALTTVGNNQLIIEKDQKEHDKPPKKLKEGALC